MTRHLCILAFLCGLDPLAVASDKEEMKKFEGTWRFVSLEMDGEAVPYVVIASWRWVVKGKEITWGDPAKGGRKSNFQIASGGSPKAIDLKDLAEDEAGKEFKGIYQFEGDRLKVCLPEGKRARGDRPRPEAFDGGAGRSLFVLERVVDDAATNKATRDDAKLIQGNWTVVELLQVNHQSTKEEKEFFESGGYKITITADKLIHSPDKSEVKYRLDPSRDPRVMDLVLDGTAFARAIYDLKGDDLKICQGRKSIDGREPEPPADFDVARARPGTFPTLFVLKRDVKKPVEK